MQHNINKYHYGTNPHELPVREECIPQDYEEIVKQCGEDPQDEELNALTLAAPWNGHTTGAIVITGNTVEGHPFYVVE